MGGGKGRSVIPRSVSSVSDVIWYGFAKLRSVFDVS